MYYDYRCTACGRTMEYHHGLKETPKYMCPCTNPMSPMKRVILSAPSFKLKGNGWYETDFKHK